jgi:hypothetical protein
MAERRTSTEEGDALAKMRKLSERRAEAKARKNKLLSKSGLRRSMKLIEDVGPENFQRFFESLGNPNISPVDAAKIFLRDMLVSEIIGYMKERGVLAPIAQATRDDLVADGMTEAASLTDEQTVQVQFTRDNVIEGLEYIVNGPEVIHDDEAAAWFKRKLAKYYEAEEKIEACREDAERGATAINLTFALRDYDILLSKRQTDGGFEILANAKAREIMKLFVTDESNWRMLDVPGDWKAIGMESHKPMTALSVKSLAVEMQDAAPNIRVGYFAGKFARVEKAVW